MAVERDERGRIKAGSVLNPGGKSADEASRVRAMHSAFAAAVTPADITAIAQAMVRKAQRGDVRAAEFVADRLFGKPAMAVNLGGPDGGIPKIIVWERQVPAGMTTGQD